MFGLGPTELIIIAFVILLIFGSKIFPKLAKGVGQGIHSFKQEVQLPEIDK